jgi:hypothetical protein
MGQPDFRRPYFESPELFVSYLFALLLLCMFVPLPPVSSSTWSVTELPIPRLATLAETPPVAQEKRPSHFAYLLRRPEPAPVVEPSEEGEPTDAATVAETTDGGISLEGAGEETVAEEQGTEDGSETKSSPGDVDSQGE